MGLIAWYPLNGNLEDYSGNGTPLSLTGDISVNDNGKIGKTYLANNTGNTGRLTRNSLVAPGENFTWCVWVKPLGYGTPSAESSTTAGLISNLNHTVNSNFSLNLRGDVNAYKLSVVAGHTDNTRSVDLLSNATIPLGVWTHIAFTRKGQTLSFYINGVFDSSVTVSKQFYTSEQKLVLYKWDTAYESSGGYCLKGYLNDVRMYDEVLSLKEIREISKAKILHYNFNECRETTENRAYGVALGFGSRWEKVDAHPTLPFKKQTDVYRRKDTSTYFGNASDFLTTTEVSSPVHGDTYAVSFWYYRESSSSPTPSINFLGHNGTSAYMGAGSVSYIGDRSVVGSWTYLTCILSVNLTTNGITRLTYINGTAGGTIADGSHIYIANFQFEKKDHSTPYTNNPRTDYIMDSSGFRNHSLSMSLALSPEWTNESAMGSGCYKFVNGKKIYSSMSMSSTYYGQSDAAMTISCWVKFTSHALSGTYGCLVGQVYYGGLCLSVQGNGSSSTKLGVYFRNANTLQNASVDIALNTLYHCVVSFDNVSKKAKIYLNGTLRNSASIVIGDTHVDISKTNFAINTGVNTSGTAPWSVMDGGMIDDVRVYATALSDSDILELYQARGSVAKNGKAIVNQVTEMPNLFDPNIILSRQNELGINKSSKIMMKDGAECLAISASSFYKSSTYYSVFPDGYFKSNTSYKFDLTMSGNLIYQGSEVPFGFVIYYTDGTKYNFDHKTAGAWKRCIYQTPSNKTIERVGVFYYIGDLFYCDIKNCSITEAIDPKVNKKSQLVCREIVENNFKPSLIDYSTWTLSDAPNWLNNGSASENCRIVYPNPKGNMDIMWATLSNDSASDADGGFISYKVPIDNTKKYRFSVWLKREDIGNGTSFFGLNAYDSSDSENGLLRLDGTTITNPYFTNFAKGHAFYNAVNNDWCLLVGYVQPNSYTGDNEATNGVYAKDGTRIGGVSGYKWSSTASKTRIRVYLYYSTTEEKQYFYRPRIDLCDGSEPSISQLLSCTEHVPLVNISGVYKPLETFSIAKSGDIFGKEFIEN